MLDEDVPELLLPPALQLQVQGAVKLLVRQIAQTVQQIADTQFALIATNGLADVFIRDSRIKIRCCCGESMIMLVEFREYYRRTVSLVGWCHVHRTEKDLEMKVRDLSLSGLSFSLESSSDEDMADLQVGDVITVRFRLDSPRRINAGGKIRVPCHTRSWKTWRQ